MGLFAARAIRVRRTGNDVRSFAARQIWGGELCILRCYWTGCGCGLFEMAYHKFKLPFHHLQGADFLVDLAKPFSADCNDLFHLCSFAAQRAR